jgi:hypothetical protein
LIIEKVGNFGVERGRVRCQLWWSLHCHLDDVIVESSMAIRVETAPKSVSEMIGEICRELSVLVLVFVPLELYRNSETSGSVIAAAIGGSFVLAAIGILIEWLRNDR